MTHKIDTYIDTINTISNDIYNQLTLSSLTHQQITDILNTIKNRVDNLPTYIVTPK